MITDDPDRYHAFNKLVLTITESSLEGVRTEHSFELRAAQDGAEVWRSSVMFAEGGSVSSDERFVGSLNTRQVIDLLDEIERTGVYEALPTVGIVEGSVDPDAAVPMVSMSVVSDTTERTILRNARADRSIVNDVTTAVRRRVDLAMERALTSAG